MTRMWARVKLGWRAFRRWRRGRPFWSGLFLFGSGTMILLPPYATLRFGDMVISINTLGGVSSLVLGCLLLVCAGAVWARPQSRVFAGIAAVLLALVALVTANLGGFVVGTLLGLVGGSLAVAWGDRRPARRAAGRRRAAGAPATPLAVVLAAVLAAGLGVAAAQRGGAATPSVSATPAAFTFPFPFPFPTFPKPSGRPSGTADPTTTTSRPSSSSTPPTTSSRTSLPAAPPGGPGAGRPLADVPLVPRGTAWTLQATRLEMGGLTFQGPVDDVLNGRPIKLLRFTAASLKITNLVQTGDMGNGHRVVTAAAPGSVSTITPGPIELRTQVLRGKLLGLGGVITIDLEHPPPLMIPGVQLPFPIFFTDATVLNTDLQGGTLRIPGGRVSVT